MSALRKRFSALAVTVAVSVVTVLGTLLFAGGAQAAPYSTQPDSAVSNEQPAEGASFTLTGVDFLPGETVQNVLHSNPYVLPSAVAGSDGSFSITVTLPSGFTGSHTISSTGATSGRVSTVPITIGGAASSSNPLASTGSDVARIGAVAVLVLVAGGLALLVGRRRKTRV
jgi:LPXTG-motif cell wall-anchored protein